MLENVDDFNHSGLNYSDLCFEDKRSDGMGISLTCQSLDNSINVVQENEDFGDNFLGGNRVVKSLERDYNPGYVASRDEEVSEDNVRLMSTGKKDIYIDKSLDFQEDIQRRKQEEEDNAMLDKENQVHSFRKKGKASKARKFPKK